MEGNGDVIILGGIQVFFDEIGAEHEDGRVLLERQSRRQIPNSLYRVWWEEFNTFPQYKYFPNI